ncbi:DNA repair protein RecO [Thalassotalea sp. PP2-459]|uniref:DNA repair protein RecO n=1 Tax=Thalassotalea sp. PP2-459 TaxID=1742724 RepID=UPI00094329D3|nr:DNA repair protein RecO [Thalassotalea sp. PP2-459]OKY25882.1 DNA repair protein RecO [Thalassotalea sp. PP2-459]
MQELEQNAFLLHARPYKEHQIIAEFITEQHGKVSAITYSGNSVKSSKKALLQPFIPLKVAFKGQRNLKTITLLEATAKSWNLTGNYLFSGFYLNELQNKLLDELLPMPNIFQQYQQSLTQLAEQQPIEPVLRNFERHLLDELGYSIDFSLAFACSTPNCHYVPEQGLVVEQLNTQLPRYPVEHLQAIAQNELADKQVMQTYKRLMREVFHHLLDGKPLNSRKLFIKRD